MTYFSVVMEDTCSVIQASSSLFVQEMRLLQICLKFHHLYLGIVLARAKYCFFERLFNYPLFLKHVSFR